MDEVREIRVRLKGISPLIATVIVLAFTIAVAGIVGVFLGHCPMIEKLVPIGQVRSGCLNCPPKPATLELLSQPHPGFGIVYLKRDGELVYPFGDDTTFEEETERYAQEYEDIAVRDPDHDWRLEIHGPLGGVIYQRHGEKEWVAVEKLEGFA